MIERGILIFLLYVLSFDLFGQQKNSQLLQVICLESKLTSIGASFKLLISNNTADTFSIPKKILPGPINSHINLGYEILYIDDCGDTSDLTENLYEDIQYNYPLPWNTKANITLPRNENQNMYSLFPGKARMIEQYISDNLLEKRGNYLLRFSIKKETLFHNDINFSDDLRSEWIKIIQTKDKIWRNKTGFKEIAIPSHS